MDIVTPAIAMALGAALASLASVFIAAIKNMISDEDRDEKAPVRTFDYSEISNLTTEEIDKIIYELYKIKLQKMNIQTGP